MSPDEQPTILTSPPNGSRPAPMGWQAPSVEEMQAMLPQYEIMEILGRGGMGAVYKGRQKSLKRLVAIKILPPDAADDEMKFVERFQNEAQTMAAMNHPAIVAVHDFGETKDGLLYFIMEYVDGTDVQKMIQASGKLSGEYALAITAHVCDALDYAHKRGVIHRDIKPANILIDQEGHIKVADFGLAKMDDPSQTSGLTKTNMAMGTPDYVAPEVLSPGMVADHRADLYAVGVMLYQMLTGEVPRGLFKLPSRKGIGSDPRFDEIICKAMEQDREERYQSAGDLRRALDVILTTPQPKDDGTGVVKAIDIPQKPVAKGPRPPGERSAAAQNPPPRGAAKEVPARQAAPSKTKAPPKKQSDATLWLSIGGIVTILGLTSFFVLGGRPKPVSSLTDSTTSAPPTKPQAPIKVRENPQTAPSASQGKTIDLLALVDLKRDVVAGEWVRTAEGLAKQGPGTLEEGAPRLQLPYEPPEEYDFEVEFTAVTHIQSVGQMISAQSRVFSWILAGNTKEAPTAGFELFDNNPTSRLSEVVAPMKGNLEEGRRYVSRVEVRAGGVRGFLNGVELVNWSGDFKRLSPGTTGTLRDDKHLGLRAARDVIFHKITVREITGTGKVDAGVVSDTAHVVAATTEAGKSARAPSAAATKDAPFENSLGMKFVHVPGTKVLCCIHETRYRDYAEYAKMAKESVDGGWKTQINDGFEIKRDAGDHPVASVSWEDAQAFCKWLSEKEGKTYRLPTDREWSLAVGIGREEEWKSDTTPATVFKVPDVYPWGNTWPPPKGAGNYSDESRRAKAPRAEAMYLDGYDDGFPTTAPVMSFEPNQPGLFDLGGNVSEWCEDWYSVEQKERVLRGASWDSRGQLSSNRLPTAPGGRSNNRGFRVVLQIAASSPLPSAAKPSVSPSMPAARPSPATAWTEWLGPKLASGDFAGDGWSTDAGGVTTDQLLKGVGIIREEVKDGAVRVTGLLRGAGMQITAREQKTTAGREFYVADDTGEALYIGRMMPDHTVVKLVEKKYPAGITRDGEHTLEFRCVGSTLTATLNGTFTITTEDSTLPRGTWTVVLKRGALMKKVEIAE